ncbi:hypothetical protein ACWCPO_01235, partial [Streptomyces albidoflavus]
MKAIGGVIRLSLSAPFPLTGNQTLTHLVISGQSTTDALAGARTLADVIEVLEDPSTLERLGA